MFLGKQVSCQTLKAESLGTTEEPIPTVKASAITLGGADLQATIDGFVTVDGVENGRLLYVNNGQSGQSGVTYETVSANETKVTHEASTFWSNKPFLREITGDRIWSMGDQKISGVLLPPHVSAHAHDDYRLDHRRGQRNEPMQTSYETTRWGCIQLATVP